jgi:hypothetical protein
VPELPSAHDDLAGRDGREEDVNTTTRKIIHWIWAQPALATRIREICTRGPFDCDGVKYLKTEHALGCWISDFVHPEDRRKPGVEWGHLVRHGVSEDWADALHAELTEGRAPGDEALWLAEMDESMIYKALMGGEHSGVFVHATVKGIDPANRYEVTGATTVRRANSDDPSGILLTESERQLCPEPIDRPCSCEVEQVEASCRLC